MTMLFQAVQHRELARLRQEAEAEVPQRPDRAVQPVFTLRRILLRILPRLGRAI